MSLGPSILRTETAGIVAPALVLYELGGMGKRLRPLRGRPWEGAASDFAVVNLGCKVNRVESDASAAASPSAGRDAREAAADLIVVNTCTVTGEAEKKTRKAVRRALRANDRARVLVTGCAGGRRRPRSTRRSDDRVRGGYPGQARIADAQRVANGGTSPRER